MQNNHGENYFLSINPSKGKNFSELTRKNSDNPAIEKVALKPRLRIAQVAPLWEPVPPPAYGGIELVVSNLTDGLVPRHEVTLFASGNSQTSAQLESVCPHALRRNSKAREYAIYETLQLQRVYEQASEFDIIHSHIGLAALPFANQVNTPTVHTLHAPLMPDSHQIFAHYSQQHYISISNAQRQPAPYLNYVCTIHNGIEPQLYPFRAQPQNPPYLAFLGRMSPEKGPQHAIAIAKQISWPLKMAGKVDVVDRKFFEQEIAPQIDGNQIEYLGEADHATKVELLGNAAVTLFPITWQEPFGLVMVESMATGTPVIGIGLGSVPEVIVHSQTGFVCQMVEEMAAFVPAALELNRQACRNYVVSCFSVEQMVDAYEAAYRHVLATRLG